VKYETKEYKTLQDQLKIPGHLLLGKVAAYTLYAWTVIGVAALGLRTLLLLFSANPLTPFVDFIYRTSDQYMAPFRGMFPAREVGATGYFDVSAMFAIIMYLLFAWAVSALVSYIDTKIWADKVNQADRIRLAERKAQSAPRKVSE
jgi:uncharacterized protein YggT (Ycf19 family)